MVDKGSTVTRADILSVLQDFQTSLQSLIQEGASIKLPFANYSTSIKGVFMGQSDNFDPSRHHIAVNIQVGKELKNFLKTGLTVERQETITPQPNLMEFKDFNSGEVNSTLSINGIGHILGHRLKFDSEVETDGIYFVKDDGTEVKVSVVAENKPSRLMFMIPAELTAGDYELQVRVKMGEETRKGILNSTLSVAG